MKDPRIFHSVGCACLALICVSVIAAEKRLIINPTFQERDASGVIGYSISGDASYQYLGDPRKDSSGWGVALHGGRTDSAGDVSQIVRVPDGARRAYRFSFRGLAQDGFSVAADGQLWMGVEFLGDDGAKRYDGKRLGLYPAIEQARKDLAVNGNNHVGGAAAWRTYSLELVVPFAQVTRLKLSVAFEKGKGSGASSDFYVTDFDLSPIAAPPVDSRETTKPMEAVVHREVVTLEHLLPIGGRWFCVAGPNESHLPDRFTADNADRLLYFDGQYETPFAGNMNSWLRKGEKDRAGHVAGSDTPVSDNVTVRFDSTSLIIHTRGLPNHPTGLFPSTGSGLLGNPNYIVEQDATYYLPVEPKERDGHTITDRHNSNHALNMGPIGIAANGIVFFNPFDADSQDATNFMDSCCGHPNPFGQYHYHKYPICVNTPWSDDGEAHSPLLGFAFDGFPIYGPYESKGVMARDLTGENKLNGFNMHYDAQRGWHYHVTPGQFPYIIGGYWGTADRRDLQRPRRGMGPPGPGRWPGEFGGPPPPPPGFDR